MTRIIRTAAMSAAVLCSIQGFRYTSEIEVDGEDFFTWDIVLKCESSYVFVCNAIETVIISYTEWKKTFFLKSMVVVRVTKVVS